MGRGTKTLEILPSGVAPLRLEGRFDALDLDLKTATPFPWHIIDADVSLNQGMEVDHSQGRAILGIGEGTTSARGCSDSSKLGEHLANLHWPLASLVKWKSPDHPRFFEYDFGIVSRRAMDWKWIQRDNYP